MLLKRSSMSRLYHMKKLFQPALIIFFLLSCGEDDYQPRIFITEHPDGKKAALSFTFDDGCYSVITKIAPLFEEYNYKATFFIVPGYIKYDDYWGDWKALSNKGFEIGNHSLTHLRIGDINDVATLRAEIDSSYSVITEKIGIPPFSFSHPYHSTSPQVDRMVFEKHFASKISPKRFCSMYSVNNKDPEEFEKIIADAISNNKWIVTSAHGVNDCYNPMTEDQLNKMLSVTRLNEEHLYVDTFGNMSKYKIEKKNAKIRVEYKENSLLIHLKSDLDNNLFDIPLTMVVWDRAFSDYKVVNEEKKEVPSFIRNDKLHFRMRLNTQVELLPR